MRQIIITIYEIYLDRLTIVVEQLHREGLVIILSMGLLSLPFTYAENAVYNTRSTD